jgi:CHASE2 domain-containing sensor protein
MASAPALRNAARTEWRVLAILLLALCAALGFQNGLGRFDATLYDGAMSLSPHTAPADVVIIAIDAGHGSAAFTRACWNGWRCRGRWQSDST